MSYRIIIDRAACSGFGSCADTAPSTFAIGADGIATAPQETDDLELAMEAARQCPMGAIAVFDANGREMR